VTLFNLINWITLIPSKKSGDMYERFPAAYFHGKKNKETEFIFTGNTPNPSQLLYFLDMPKYFTISPPKRPTGEQFYNKQLTSLRTGLHERRANIPLTTENEKEKGTENEGQ
jgi:hypothetical protein